MASSSTARHNQTEPKHAFDQLAPSPASTSTKSWQIFINHRGLDVKRTFASKIHQTLDGMGFRAFLDVGIEPGDVIQAEIEAAMTSASLHIAIFSPNYAQSPWCLAELSFMLKTGKKIIPIFYHVEISDLRWVHQGKGIYAHAFSEHEEKGRYTQEKLGEWKKALHNLSFYSGHEVNNTGDEDRVLKNIVNSALKVMKKVPLWVAEHPLGLDKLVHGFESVAREDEVKITGIVGMGGSGKTTLAKELFNRNFASFEQCSFISDVRDAASRNALLDKQKKLLEDLGVHHSRFDNVDEGKAILANRLSSLRVLIVLDDVDHIDQVNALLPNKDNVGSHSMVILTTRELGVLKSCRIYKMPGLERSHAEQLFCWHAFRQPSPPAAFESLVEKFMSVCNRLPLSLKVLGGQLYGNDSIAYWEALLNKISRILPIDIKRSLQVSYDALDEEEKEMFLDVACFLIGENISTAIAVWDGSGWSGLHGLQILVNKCLVELVNWKIRMHDHLRDMGREIASRHSAYRLWQPEQIDNIKKHFKETVPIRGIRSADAFLALMGNSIRQSGRLKFSDGFQILSVEGNEFTEEFASESEDLVWLRWDFFPLKKLPPWLSFKHLSVLELNDAKELEELWEDNAVPPLQLRELTIENEPDDLLEDNAVPPFQRLPSSIGCLKYLKRLVFSFYGSSLPEEFCGLCSLEYLELFSPTLFSLPNCFGNLISLKYIMLPSCQKLSTLPDSLKQLIHLERLNLLACEMLSTLPDDFGNLTSLKSIDLSHCIRLSTLPKSFKQLIHLENLDLSWCKMLSSLPDGFGNLTNLKHINLWQQPDSFRPLIHLEEQCSSGCDEISSLPAGFGDLISLETLNLESCRMLSSLPAGFGGLKSLKTLNLSHCRMLSSLPDDFGNLINLRDISLSGSDQLSMLPESFKQLIHLERLSLSRCDMLSTLPDDFGNLINLKNIELSYCKQLNTLPDSFKQLIHLKRLNLKGCAKLQLKLDMLENMRKLEVLNLAGCEELEDLPHQIVNQASLRELDLTGCVKLRGLPTGIGKLLNLVSLRIVDCPLEELSRFIYLDKKNLFMDNCPMVEKIKGLLHYKSLENLYLETACGKVPDIQILEKLEGRLETLMLKCDTISAAKPCIRSLKECPWHMFIQGSARPVVEPIFDSSKFPDLTVKELEPSDAYRIVHLAPFLCYVEQKEKNGGRKFVRIRVSLKQYIGGEDKQAWMRVDRFLDVENEKAMVVRGVRGGEGRVVETFYKLLALLE